MNRITHVQQMRAQYNANQSEVLYLTGLTLNALLDLKVDTGRRWLAQFLVDTRRISEQEVQELLLLDEVWQWWHNEWCRLDHSIVLPVLYKLTQDERLEQYKEMHNGVLNRMHPCHAILESGFIVTAKQVFKPLVDDEKRGVCVVS